MKHKLIEMVEVAGIEPASLNNLIKAATCLAPDFRLILQLLQGRICKTQLFKSRPAPQSLTQNQPTSALFHLVGKMKRGPIVLANGA